MPPYKLIIFDCDGVIVDSEPLAAKVVSEMVAELGLQMEVEDILDRFNGRKVSHWVSEIEEQLGRKIAEQFIPEFRRRSAVMFRKELTPVPGIRELLEGIAAPYCMASSGPMHKIELTLTLTNMLNYFEGKIFSGYEVGAWKPDPALFLHAAEAFNTPPEHCAVIEDSLAGIEAGLSAGMTVFHYHKYGSKPEKDDERLFRFDSMYDMPELLKV